MKRAAKTFLLGIFVLSLPTIDAQNANQEFITIRASDGEYPIDQVSFDQLKKLSQTVREQAESMTDNQFALFELDRNDLKIILDLIKTTGRTTELEKKMAQQTDLFTLAKLYKQLRFLDILSLSKAVERRINQLVATEKDLKRLQALLKYLGQRNTDSSLINPIKKKIADTIVVILKDKKEYPVDKFMIDQLASESKVIKEELAAIRRNQLTLPELTVGQFSKIVTLFSLYRLPKLINAYLSQQSFDQLVDLLTGVSFLQLGPLTPLLEQSLAKKIIAQKEDNRKELFDEIEQAVGKGESYQNIAMITTNLKSGMYNFVLKDGLVTKPLNNKNTIDALIKSSQTLQDLAEDTGQKDTTVFYLQPISKKTFENLYALIQYLSDEEKLASKLTDTTSYGLLPIALLLKAADYLAIEKLLSATLNELATRLLTTESLRLFQEGRSWGTFLGLDENFDDLVAKKIRTLLKVADFNLLHTLKVGVEVGGEGSPVMEWNSDGTKLALLFSESPAQIWTPSLGNQLKTINENNFQLTEWKPVRTWRFSSRTGLLEVNDLFTENKYFFSIGNVHPYSIKFSKDFNQVITASDDNTVKIWNPLNGSLRKTFQVDNVKEALLSPDTTKLATQISYDGTYKIWDTSNSSLITTFQATKAPRLELIWSPDSKYVAIVSSKHMVQIWDPVTGNLLKAFQANKISKAVWSPESTYLGIVSYGGTVDIWNPFTGELLHVFKLDEGIRLVWNPDGIRFATGSYGGNIKIWTIGEKGDISLAQIMLIALAKKEYENNRTLSLNARLQEIYQTLTPLLQNLLIKVFGVKLR